MEVVVLGRNETVPDEMRAQVRAKVAKLGKLPVLEHAEVRLHEDREAPATTRRVCEVTLTGHGHTLRASAAAHELSLAVDQAVHKLEHQVERLKGKLVERSQPRRARAEGRTRAEAGDEAGAGAGDGAAEGGDEEGPPDRSP